MLTARVQPLSLYTPVDAWCATMPLLDEDQFRETLAEVVARLRAELSPSAVYAFGSYVYGQPGRDSDLDLLVVVEQSAVGPYERDAQAIRALRGIRMPIDVQVYTREEFDQRSRLPVSFERTVKTKGKLVYAA